MSARNDDSSRTDEPDSRTIPDGGLADAMPDWVRATPGWKQPADRATSMLLPPPDTSPIDPRTMLAADDLPVWLRDLRDATAIEPPDEEPTPQAAAESPVKTERLKTDPRAEPAPVVWGSTLTADPRPVRTLQIEPNKGRWWTADWVLGVLMLAIVATIAYVVLVASGVL